MNTYTAFCQAVTGKGTIWICAIKAEDVDKASTLAQLTCSVDWSCEPENVHVLGIAAGDVDILLWNDLV